MIQKESIRLFEEREVRAIWGDEQGGQHLPVVDVISTLTDSPNPREHWSVLKTRLKREGSELTTNCSRLRMQTTDGKKYLIGAANTEQLFCPIQPVPFPKVEPSKSWIAQVAKERSNQAQDPKLSIEQAMAGYKRLGYLDNWISQRLKSIEIRKDLTDEWKKRGLGEGLCFATLTDIIYKSRPDTTSKEYKRFKRLRRENPRDSVTNKELVLNMLAELSAKEMSEASEPDTFSEHINVVQQGGEMARNTRLELEAKTGKSVISPFNTQKIISLKRGENERDV